MTDVTCDEFVNQLMDFLDDELTESVRIAIQAHLTICAHCGGLMATYCATITITRSLPRCSGPLPARFEEKLRAILAALPNE